MAADILAPQFIKCNYLSSLLSLATRPTFLPGGERNIEPKCGRSPQQPSVERLLKRLSFPHSSGRQDEPVIESGRG